MKKVFIFFADGFEEVEGLTAVDLLRRAGINIKTVSISKDRTVTGSHGIPITADGLFEDWNFREADGLLLPGGMPGTKNLGQHSGLAALLKEKFEEGRLIGAICAAPSILGGLGILKGLKATCYPGFEQMLSGAEAVEDDVAEDKNVITSRGAGTAIAFSLAVIKWLDGEEKADSIKESILYRC